MNKVLIIGLAPNMGGVENIILNIITRIDSIQFDLVVFGDNCEWKEKIKNKNIKILYFCPRRKNLIKNYIQQKKFIREHGEEYKFVWIQMSSASNIIAHKLVKKYSKSKIITHSHGTNFETENRLLRYIHMLFHRINHKKMINNSDYLFACSEKAAKWLFGKDNYNKSFIINNSIETSKFIYNEEDRKKMRNELNISNNFVISHVGRFCSVKNHTFIIDVFKEILRLEPDARLLLVGDGYKEQEIKEKVKKLDIDEKVNFLGYREDINNIMNCSDIFILPSHFEGFPVTLVEAQASGLNCFVSDVVTREVEITDLITFISLDEDPKEWARLILKKQLNIHRKYTSDIIKSKGYDINNICKKIEYFLTYESQEILKIDKFKG